MKVSKIIGLIYCLIITTTVVSQKIEYGNSPSAGYYFDVGNCSVPSGLPFVDVGLR
jgi:hypothetical protein